MIRKKKLLEDARKVLEESTAKNIYYVGTKPWYDRGLTKFKYRLFFGLATGVISGLNAFSVIDTNIFNNESLNIFEIKKIKQEQISIHNTMTNPIVVKTEEKNSFENSLELFKKENLSLSISFTNIKTQRDVAKAFLGINNFIALASEMEGFRGDLHKDPATGLNIGFGYNITKRSQANSDSVAKDLLSIGINNNLVEKIIELSQLPNDKLSKEIKIFNEKNNFKNNNIIDIEQGVALLKRTEKEYKNQAKASFPNCFEKMGKNQQEILTYAAYKAGYESLSKYKKAVKIAQEVYSKKDSPNFNELKKIAKELNFYYQKDGKEMVLDERATLIAHTFITQDYLGVQIGKIDNLKLNKEKLFTQKIDFSHFKFNLSSKSKNVNFVIKNKEDINVLINKLRNTNIKSINSYTKIS